MFNRYELKMMQDAIIKQYAKEYHQRECDGLSQETIKAQLQGLFDVLVKINIELAGDQA